MFEVKNKRLLVLGSTADIATIVERAKKMGVYVIVTDYKPLDKAPAKQIADKYYNISIADIEKIVALIKNEKIDGVLTGFTDSYLKFYYEICKKANLPCYGESKQFELATNKMKFKKMCRECGVGVIPGDFAYSLSEATAIAQKEGYPLILKPADNSGSRGVIRCNAESEMQDAFEYAMSFSDVGCVICEKYMDCDNIGASYQLVNGEIFLTAVSDRHIYKSNETGSSITKDLSYPSVYTERYLKEVNDSFIQMLKTNGFQNGMLSNQVFVDEQGFYVCEICFRPSGGHHYSVIYDQSGIDSLGMLIKYSLNGNVTYTHNSSPFFKNNCGMIRIVGKANETISIVNGMNSIKELDFVFKATQYLFPGDTVGKDGTTAQTVACICYRAQNFDELKSNAVKILNMISCKNNKNEELIKNIQYYI